MSQSQSTTDLYRVNVSRGAERLKPRGNFHVEQELYELCNLSGVTLDPDVFQILLDLIQINVSPNALVQVLKKMTKQGTQRGSLENVTPSTSYAQSESGRSHGGTSVSSDSAFEASKGSVFRDETTSETEKSSTERLASRLRALKAGRKAT
ncbi:mitotic-spindle organizing 2-like [Paramuricea clavata]|uniref:Mitotic-spindle organizing 2-like n=1 Tax=Paramuricea clavata TaxID=317549 RepID=A0A7D9I9D5_PARCT|nr:mitotic-spindle organizing 2-like [Paramuricea clavata]